MSIAALTTRWGRFLGIFAVLAILTGCASSGPEDEQTAEVVESVNDPLEDVNRYVFELNMAADKIVFRPLAEMYRAALPQLVQDSVRNFLDNLRTPVILANDLMQGEFSRAWDTLARFGINTTIGAGGFLDLAEGWGWEQHDEDFGQTLGSWGVDSGPYLMLPVFGPSNPRDAVGRVVDFFLDPINWVTGGVPGVDGASGLESADMALRFTDSVDQRARNIETLDTIEANSLDFYATIRSLYRQRRQDEINNGESSAQQTVPSISQTVNP